MRGMYCVSKQNHTHWRPSVIGALKYKRDEGFTFIEFIIATGLVATLVMSLSHMQRSQRIENSLASAAQEINGIKETVHYFLLTHSIAPDELDLALLVAQDLYIGPVLNPWNLPYVFEPDLYGLKIKTEVPHSHRAEQLASRLANARADGTTVVTRIPMPVQLEDPADALHRSEISGRPELNQMSANIDMQGFGINDVGFIHADRLEAEQLFIQLLYGESMSIDELDAQVLTAHVLAAEFLTGDDGLFTNLTAQDAHFSHVSMMDVLGPIHEVSVQNLRGEHLEVAALNIDSLSIHHALFAAAAEIDSINATSWSAATAYIDLLSASSAHVTQLFADAFEAELAHFDVIHTTNLHVTGTLIAEDIIAQTLYAADVITPHGSLNQAIDRLNDFESLWIACVQSGGCQ